MTGSTPRRGGKLRVDRIYLHPPATVWRALTEPELLGRWLMETDFAPKVGHEFTFRTEPGPGFDGVIHCEVLALDAPRSMTWSWRGGPLDTVVRFTLEPLPAADGEDATRLVVDHTGFRGFKGRLVQAILGMGNRTLYGKRLPALLDDLAGREGLSPSAGAHPCMSPWQRVLITLSGLVPGRRARRGVRGPSSRD